MSYLFIVLVVAAGMLVADLVSWFLLRPRGRTDYVVPNVIVGVLIAGFYARQNISVNVLLAVALGAVGGLVGWAFFKFVIIKLILRRRMRRMPVHR